MLPKVRAGGSRNGQVAALNITNERVYQDSPLMSIDRPTFAAAHLPLRKRSGSEEIIAFDENITKIIKSRRFPISSVFRAQRSLAFVKKMNKFVLTLISVSTSKNHARSFI